MGLSGAFIKSALDGKWEAFFNFFKAMALYVTSPIVSSALHLLSEDPLRFTYPLFLAQEGKIRLNSRSTWEN